MEWRQCQWYTFVSRNGGRFDSYFFLKALLENGVSNTDLDVNWDRPCSKAFPTKKFHGIARKSGWEKSSFRFIGSVLFTPTSLAELPVVGLNPRVYNGDFPYLYNPKTQLLHNAEGWPAIGFFDTGKASTPEFAAWHQSVKDEPFD